MPTNETSGATAGNGAQGLMQSIQQQATSALSTQKDRAAESMRSVIEAVRQTGESLREKNGTVAGYVDSAANQLERWSTQLRNRDVSELLDGVGSFARREPALFIGSGLALGLVAARFLKSSAPESRSMSSGTPGNRVLHGAMSGGGISGGMSNRMSTSGQATPQFATSGSSGSAGVLDTTGSRVESTAASVAADRSGSRTPRTPRPRARTTDEG